jgi:quinol monooxygenase YgiN
MKKLYLLLVPGLLILVLACAKKQPAPAETAITAPIADTISKKMITAKVFVKPGNVADFIKAAGSMIDSSNAEPGCESYMLYQDPYDNTKFIFIEIWKDQSAIDAHFAMPYFIAWGPKTKDWLSQPTELKIFDVVPGK